MERTLILAMKVMAALATLGLYPILPWFVRWHQGVLYRWDVRDERYRQQVRRAARRGARA